MRINNVGINVKDLEGAKKFFEDYFHAVEHAYYEENNGFKEYILRLDEGAKLEIMTKPEIIDREKHNNDAGLVHICIKVADREELDRIIAKIHADGYEVQYEPATVGGKEIRAVTFEDIILEVCC